MNTVVRNSELKLNARWTQPL